MTDAASIIDQRVRIMKLEARTKILEATIRRTINETQGVCDEAQQTSDTADEVEVEIKNMEKQVNELREKEAAKRLELSELERLVNEPNLADTPEAKTAVELFSKFFEAELARKADKQVPPKAAAGTKRKIVDQGSAAGERPDPQPSPAKKRGRPPRDAAAQKASEVEVELPATKKSQNRAGPSNTELPELKHELKPDSELHKFFEEVLEGLKAMDSKRTLQNLLTVWQRDKDAKWDSFIKLYPDHRSAKDDGTVSCAAHDPFEQDFLTFFKRTKEAGKLGGLEFKKGGGNVQRHYLQ